MLETIIFWTVVVLYVIYRIIDGLQTRRCNAAQKAVKGAVRAKDVSVSSLFDIFN